MKDVLRRVEVRGTTDFWTPLGLQTCRLHRFSGNLTFPWKSSSSPQDDSADLGVAAASLPQAVSAAASLCRSRRLGNRTCHQETVSFFNKGQKERFKMQALLREETTLI